MIFLRPEIYLFWVELSRPLTPTSYPLQMESQIIALPSKLFYYHHLVYTFFRFEAMKEGLYKSRLSDLLM